MVGFAAAIEAGSSKHAAALARMPFDEEVRLRDEQDAAYVAAWRSCSDWRQVPDGALGLTLT